MSDATCDSILGFFAPFFGQHCWRVANWCKVTTDRAPKIEKLKKDLNFMMSEFLLDASGLKLQIPMNVASEESL